jgi:hypothetical protein
LRFWVDFYAKFTDLEIIYCLLCSFYKKQFTQLCNLNGAQKISPENYIKMGLLTICTLIFSPSYYIMAIKDDIGIFDLFGTKTFEMPE